MTSGHATQHIGDERPGKHGTNADSLLVHPQAQTAVMLEQILVPALCLATARASPVHIGFGSRHVKPSL